MNDLNVLGDNFDNFENKCKSHSYIICIGNVLHFDV